MQKPVKAFISQDHQAHIQVHMAAMQDPKIMQLMQNNPAAQQVQASMMAHINEHLGFEYRKQIELQLGFNLPPTVDESGEEKHMDPEVEARLAPLLAQAAQQLLQQNQAQAAQQQAQQTAQDPIVQMQQQELQIKQAEQQRKAAKDASDLQLKQEQQQIERERIQAELIKEAAKMEDGNQRDIINKAIEILKHISSQQAQENIMAQNQSTQLEVAAMKQQQMRNQLPTEGE